MLQPGMSFKKFEVYVPPQPSPPYVEVQHQPHIIVPDSPKSIEPTDSYRQRVVAATHPPRSLSPKPTSQGPLVLPKK